MRGHWVAACLTLFAGRLLGESPAQAPAPAVPDTTRPGKPAKLRFAGVFITGFTIHRLSEASCTVPPDPKPWFVLDCGMWRCPRTVLLGMPAPPSYSNWEKSPRVREIEIDPDKPLAFKLTGSYNEVLTFNPTGTSKYTVSPCNFNVSFTPEAGKMYEVSLDAERRTCVLSVTELVRQHGFWEKMPLVDAERHDCAEAPATGNQ